MNPRTLSGLAAACVVALTLGGCGAAARNDGHMFQRWADAVTSIRVSEDDASAARPQAQTQAQTEAAPTTAVVPAQARAGDPAAMKVELVDALQMPTARAAGLRAAVAMVDAQLQGLRAPEVPATVESVPTVAPSPATAMVQLASFSDETAARRAWTALKSAHGDALTGLDARFERVDLGARGVWVRLKAGPVAGAAQAERVCAAAADPRWCAAAWARGAA